LFLCFLESKASLSYLLKPHLKKTKEQLVMHRRKSEVPCVVSKGLSVVPSPDLEQGLPGQSGPEFPEWAPKQSHHQPLWYLGRSIETS
jgi:hypothetical protein